MHNESFDLCLSHIIIYFILDFSVLCTAPNKYKVVDPEGTIKARCCVDIVIRHTAPLTTNCNVIDKFRIQMQEHPTKQVIFVTSVTKNYST